MEVKKNKLLNLIILTVVILLVSIELSLGHVFKGEGLFYLLGTIIGLYLMLRHYKGLTVRIAIGAGILAILYSLYNLYNGEGIPLATIVMLILSYLGAMATVQDLELDYQFRKYSLWKTLVIIVLVGGVLGGINYLLYTQSHDTPPGFHLTLSNLFKSFIPGIGEEIILRFTFLALVFHILERKPEETAEHVCTYILMILPHVLGHFNGSIPLGSVVFLSLLFGLPLAYLQKEVDLLTSMGAHSLTDFLRFVLLNL